MQLEPHKRTCVGTGLIVLDVIRSRLQDAITEKRCAGGSCGNVLTILAYFGWTANAVGRIGDDHPGRELLQDLDKWGVQTTWLRVESGRRTPVIVQENSVDTKGRPRHRFSRKCPVCGASLPAYRPLLANDVDALSSQLPPHAVFFFDRVSAGTLGLARKSRARGAFVVFEPSGIKDQHLFAECIRTAHVVKYSNERIRGIHEVVASAEVPVEIETRGAQGLRLRVKANGRAGFWLELPAFSAPDLLDAAGSGDWCTAGLIQHLLSTTAAIEDLVSNVDAIVAATRFGQALATLCCRFEGARGLMDAADAQAVINAAESIVSGLGTAPSLVPAKIKLAATRRNGDACLACSSTQTPLEY